MSNELKAKELEYLKSHNIMTFKDVHGVEIFYETLPLGFLSDFATTHTKDLQQELEDVKGENEELNSLFNASMELVSKRYDELEAMKKERDYWKTESMKD